GVDVIEAGFAISSPGDFEGVRAVARTVKRATVASLARTRKEDVDASVEALQGAHRSRLHVFIATSALHMEKKLGPEPEEVLEQARWTGGYAATPADELECTVNGIGERAGNAALEEVVMALRVRRDEFGVETGVDVGQIGVTSALVSRLTGYAVQRNKAIVGANAFAHEAGIHQDGMLKDTATYQIMDPAELGLTMTLPLGKHSGRHAFAQACQDAGIELSVEQLNAAFAPFKGLADTRKAVTLYDVFEKEVV